MNSTLPDKNDTNAGRKAERPARNSEGMTIIELMVVLVIASIFSIAMYKVFESSSKMATRQNVNIDAQEGLRSSLNFMAKDISMAGLATNAQGGLPGIIIAEEDRIRFWADRNVNGTIDTGYAYGGGPVPEVLEFAINGGRLVVIPNPSMDTSQSADLNNGIVLLDDVQEMRFEYLDPNGAELLIPLADPGDRTELKRIRSVEITLASLAAVTAISGDSEGETGRLTMLKYIRCRNLGIW